MDNSTILVRKLTGKSVIVLIPAGGLLSAVIYGLVVYFTLTFDVNLLFEQALIITVIACAITAIALANVLRFRFEGEGPSFRASDYAISAVFIGLFSSSIWWGMLFPSIIYYVVPFAAGLTFYLPVSAIFGAYMRLVPKPGAVFLLLLGYGVISEIIYPNVFWFPYYLAWGAIMEVYLITTKDFLDSRISRIVGGYLFGLSGAGLAIVYMLIGWRFYRPLFLSVPAITMDGLFGVIGAYIGAKIGDRARSVSML